jgi:hypothetical protein
MLVGSTIGLTVGLTADSTVGSTVGSKVGLTVGSMFGSTWLCWAINLSKAFDSSDEKLNKLVILQTRFTSSPFYWLLTTISQEGSNIYYNSDMTL